MPRAAGAGSTGAARRNPAPLCRLLRLRQRFSVLPDDVHQVRTHQRGLGWGTDYPDAEINFSIRLSELTKTRVSRTSDNEPNHFVVRPTDDTLFQCPFIIMSDPGSVGFTPEDAAPLREYLLKGGFLWVDDYWGPWAWDDWAGS